MVKLEDLKLQAICFTDGGRGSWSRTYRDEKFGITVFDFRESRGEPIVRTVAVDSIPGINFKTIREAVEQINKKGEQKCFS